MNSKKREPNQPPTVGMETLAGHREAANRSVLFQKGVKIDRGYVWGETGRLAVFQNVRGC